MAHFVEQKHVSLELALGLIARVREEADKQSLSLAVCVVDGSAQSVATQRMDGSPLGAMTLAFGKAVTAALWDMPSGELMQSTQPGGADWGLNVADPRIVVYAGGIPLRADGALVGGIGASGGTAEQDEACVLAAAQALGLA